MKKTPNYKLTAHDGTIVAQHHYTGHVHGIVYFLESISNPPCRDYCRELSQWVPRAQAFKTSVVGIAPEPVEALGQAHAELELNFPLLSDPGSVAAQRYGLLGGGWFRSKRVSPALIVHDKYGIAYFVGVAEKRGERPRWEEIESVLKQFPRG